MVGGKAYDHTKAGVQEALNESLTALGTDKVDLYYLHAPDREVDFAETLEAINDAYKAGRFERFGISNFKVDEIEKVVHIIEEKKYPFKVGEQKRRKRFHLGVADMLRLYRFSTGLRLSGPIQCRHSHGRA